MSEFFARRFAPLMRPLFTSLIVCAALTGCGSSNQDKLDDNQLSAATSTEPVAADDRCRGAAAHEAVKRELFRRAAEVRGSNGQNYAKIANFAVLVVDGAAPVTPAAPNQAVDCRGHATLRLPAGLKAVGGRTSLAGDIGYTVGGDRGRTVTLGQGDAIIVPLATLTQDRAASAPSPVILTPPAPRPVAPPPEAAPTPPPVDPARAAEAPPGPSFDCQRARTQSEFAVCHSGALAARDREMAARYRNAVARADRAQAQLLDETRTRFLGFRNACGTDDCIAQTYRGRMREIDDIMTGRWRPTR
ncbi:MAG: hypothetical protein LH465_09760 [Sphingomonas bacterium]|nr:hypothetical protein [Sphingomonas bacterium]